MGAKYLLRETSGSRGGEIPLHPISTQCIDVLFPEREGLNSTCKGNCSLHCSPFPTFLEALMEEEASEEELLDIPQRCTDQQRKREKMAAEGGRIVHISPQPPARPAL